MRQYFFNKQHISFSRGIMKKILPPIVYDILIRLYRFCIPSNPRWNTIQSGILKGNEIYVNQRTPHFKMMVDGNYDLFFTDYLNRCSWSGAVVLDIGGHIGYSALTFAALTGAEGKVVVFEPNRFNLERLMMNVSRNKNLREIIRIEPVALSDFNGESEFNLSSNIDDETSSGGFLEGAAKPLENVIYSEYGFRKEKVKVVRLDDYIKKLEIAKVDLIKIDVEGAEYMALAGGIELLKRDKPTLLIEVHSIIAMMKTCELLLPLGYKIEILDKDQLSRCFISAVYS